MFFDAWVNLVRYGGKYVGYNGVGWKPTDLFVISDVRRCYAPTSMKTPTPNPCESTLLRDVAREIERRGKAIRYHGRLECSRDVEDSGERLNIEFSGTLGFRVRLSIWADGVFWVGVTASGPRRSGGRAHHSEAHGGLIGLDASDVRRRFEQTIHSPTDAATIWPTSSVEAATPNITDAGNGSNGICRVIEASRSPSPDPGR